MKKHIALLLTSLALLFTAQSLYSKTIEEILPENSHIVRLDSADLLGLGKNQTIVYYTGYQKLMPELDPKYSTLPRPTPGRSEKPKLFWALLQFEDQDIHVRGSFDLGENQLSAESGAYFLDSQDPKPYLAVITHDQYRSNLEIYYCPLHLDPTKKIPGFGSLITQTWHTGLAFTGPYDETQKIFIRRPDGQYIFKSPLGCPGPENMTGIPNVIQFHNGSFVIDNYGNPDIFEPYLKAIAAKALELPKIKPSDGSDYGAKNNWQGFVTNVISSLNAYLYTGHYQEGEKIAKALLKIGSPGQPLTVPAQQSLHVFLGSCYLHQGNKKWKTEFETAADATSWGRAIGFLMMQGDYYLSILDYSKALSFYQAAKDQLQYTYGVSDKVETCKNMLAVESNYKNPKTSGRN